MKQTLKLLAFFVFLTGCAESSNYGDPTDHTINVEKPTKIDVKSNVRDTFDCKIFGKKDSGSDHWLASEEMYFAMTNDIFQKEQVQSSSYNVFQVYNTINCNLIYNGKLPMVDGLDKPYKLQADIYESVNQLVCTQSPENVFCYHVGRKEIIVPLSPPISISKSGTYDPRLQRDLTVWENYLFGWTDQIGVYAFDMTNLHNPSRVMQSGTYSTKMNTIYFFVMNDLEGIQLLVSEVIDGELRMNPIFSSAKNLSRKVYRDRSGGRYAFLKSNVGLEFVAVDLANREIIKLPQKVQSSKSTVKKYLQSLN